MRLPDPDSTDFCDHCLALKDPLYAMYGEVTERPWGLLVCNPGNPTHHDANHARRLTLSGDEVPAVAAEIADFYRSAGVTPRVRVDPRTRPGDLTERLVALGWKLDSTYAGLEMLWRAEPVDPPALPANLRIDLAGPGDYETLARLLELDRTYGNPEYELAALRRKLGRPGVEIWYLADGELAVACAELMDLTVHADRRGSGGTTLGRGTRTGAPGERWPSHVPPDPPGLPRLEGVLTHPAHRRRGYGRLLQRALQRAAVERRAPGLILGVEAANANAVALYRSVGYRPGPVYQVTSLVLEGGT